MSWHLPYILVGFIFGELMVYAWGVASKEVTEGYKLWKLYLVAVFLWPFVLMVYFMSDGDDDA